MSRRAPTAVSLLFGVLSLGGLVSACGDDRVPLPDEGNTAGCDAAFRRAVASPDERSLEMTLVACDGIGEWVPEAASHPDLVPGEKQVRFAATICATARQRDIVESATCVQAFERYPDLRPQPSGDGDIEREGPPEAAAGSAWEHV